MSDFPEYLLAELRCLVQQVMEGEELLKLPLLPCMKDMIRKDVSHMRKHINLIGKDAKRAGAPEEAVRRIVHGITKRCVYCWRPSIEVVCGRHEGVATRHVSQPKEKNDA